MIISPGFSSLPLCCFNTHSQQPWKPREWQMAARKVGDSRKSAEMLLHWQGRKRRNKNRKTVSQAFGLRAPPGTWQFIHTEIRRDSTWNHFHCGRAGGIGFLFVVVVLNPFVWIWAVTVWKFLWVGLRRSWDNSSKSREEIKTSFPIKLSAPMEYIPSGKPRSCSTKMYLKKNNNNKLWWASWNPVPATKCMTSIEYK